MGWGYGHNNDGREVGYTVPALCDKNGCKAKIDRGLAFVCGGMHDGGEHGCGKYFCIEHLRTMLMKNDEVEQFCESCYASLASDLEFACG